MVTLYKQFLEFLPVRLRAGIQGRYLFQEPSMNEKELNAERLVARDIEAEKREDAEIMAQLGLEEKNVNMDKLKKVSALAFADEVDESELSALISEMTGVSKEEVADLIGSVERGMGD